MLIMYFLIKLEWSLGKCVIFLRYLKHISQSNVKNWKGDFSFNLRSSKNFLKKTLTVRCIGFVKKINKYMTL